MNTKRMNRLEELGRVDAEKAFTKKGARNLRDEKKRIVRELKAKGGPAGGRTIYDKYPKARRKATGEAYREGGMKKDRLKEGYKARRKDIKSIVKMGVEALKKKRAKKANGGSLKKVQPHQKGLKKLPTKVRNKMGYMKKGGRVGMGKALRGGGCVR
jgi:hypothetical protein